MILFTPEMAQAILDGRKTVTRRRWKKPRVKVGGLHQCYTRPAFARPPGKPFARVRIVNVAFEWGVMGGLTREQQEAEAGLEGFATRLDFYDAWYAINGPDSVYDGTYRVEFRLEAEGSGE